MAAAAAASSLFSESSDNQALQTISSSLPSTSECSHRGISRMFKVPSLVFDIELEDNGIGGHWQEDDWEEDEVVTEIQRFVQPANQAEARLLSDVRVACPHAKDGQDTARLVSILSALGYKCCVRTALGGGDGADCLRNLRHTFITCETPSAIGAPGRRYIIDAQFKEQFIIAKTTARYAAILAAVPQVFVGPEEHLSLLVNFLCTEMSAAFRQLGSVLPPWRQASSMLSKWRPRKSVDERMGSVRLAAASADADVILTPGPQLVTAGALLPVVNGGAVMASDKDALDQQPRTAASPWACKPAPGPLERQQPQQAQPWWQQPQQQFGGMGMGASGIAAAVARRPSFEPQRVVFGGNFVPIIPSPAPAPAS